MMSVGFNTANIVIALFATWQQTVSIDVMMMMMMMMMMMIDDDDINNSVKKTRQITTLRKETGQW